MCLFIVNLCSSWKSSCLSVWFSWTFHAVHRAKNALSVWTNKSGELKALKGFKELNPHFKTSTGNGIVAVFIGCATGEGALDWAWEKFFVNIIGHTGVWTPVYEFLKQQTTKYEDFNENATENKNLWVLVSVRQITKLIALKQNPKINWERKKRILPYEETKPPQYPTCLDSRRTFLPFKAISFFKPHCLVLPWLPIMNWNQCVI